MAVNVDIKMNLTGGAGGSPSQTGQKGTAWSTDCPPGFSGIFCQPCLNGTYKNEYSNIECKKCQSMPVAAET